MKNGRFLYCAWIFIPPLVATVIVGLLDARYVKPLLLSFLNGEAAVAYWVYLGIPPLKAVAISSVCGNYDLFCWFWLASHWHAFNSFIEKQLEKVKKNNSLPFSAYNRLKDGWIHSQKSGKYAFLKKWKFPYLALLLFGFVPGGVFPGIGMSKFFKLGQVVSFLLIGTGNTLKMAVFGMLGFTVFSLLKFLVDYLIVFFGF